MFTSKEKKQKYWQDDDDIEVVGLIYKYTNTKLV